MYWLLLHFLFSSLLVAARVLRRDAGDEKMRNAAFLSIISLIFFKDVVDNVIE